MALYVNEMVVANSVCMAELNEDIFIYLDTFRELGSVTNGVNDVSGAA